MQRGSGNAASAYDARTLAYTRVYARARGIYLDMPYWKRFIQCLAQQVLQPSV